MVASPDSLLADLVVTERQRVALLRALAGGRLSHLAIALTRVIFGATSRARARDAQEHVRRALQRASARAIRALEREYRSPRFYSSFGADATLTRASYASWSGLGEAALGALAVASVQRSGPVRELAVRELAEVHAPAACALLMVRLNDPVRPIRACAHAALGRWLVSAHVSTLARYLPLVDGMATWVRTAGTQDTVATRVYKLLRAHPQALLAHTRGADPEVRLSCYQQLFICHRGRTSIADVLRAAQRDRDPRIRHRAVEVILDVAWTPNAVRPTLLAAMADDRSPLIRVRALRWLNKQPDAAVHVRRAVFDRNANVRFVARRYAHRLGLHIPYRQRALDALAAADGDRSQRIAALATLSDHGLRADCPHVMPYLSHRIAAVRREAERTSIILECPDALATGR